VLVCHPDHLDAAIEKLVTDRDYRRQLGSEAQAYVRNQWHPTVVAARFIQLASGAAQPEWTYDPAAIRYVYGWGLPSGRLREVVLQMVAAGGIEALGVSDKPELQKRFLDLVRSTGNAPSVVA
jgi:hypothetical protein